MKIGSIYRKSNEAVPNLYLFVRQDTNFFKMLWLPSGKFLTLANISKYRFEEL